MFGIGISEILLLLLIITLFVGANRLPEIGRSLGEAIREFRRTPKRKDEDHE